VAVESRQQEENLIIVGFPLIVCPLTLDEKEKSLD